MKFIGKKKFSFFAFLVVSILRIEVIGLGLFNYVQPTYRTEIRDVLKEFESPEGGLYYSLQNRHVSLQSGYEELEIYFILNNALKGDFTNLMSKIMSYYDAVYGLFIENDKPFLPATYYTI